jgi:putative transposase
MKEMFPQVNLEILCGLFGNSRQAWHKRQKSIYYSAIQEHLIVEMVRNNRKQMPRIGARKLHKLLTDNNLRVGRDALFEILRRNNLLVRRRRTRIKTTNSHHWFRKYSNLIKGLSLTAPHQLWVSDITYIKTTDGNLYLFLITDAYSKKIIGYCLSQNLKASNAVNALKLALRQLPKGIENLIHHSDRGIQYCCNDYVKSLKKRDIKISMTQNGDPLDNSIAERVNGILKDEWLYDIDDLDQKLAFECIPQIINIYNHKRPHLSIDLLTPDQAHQKTGKLKRRWKNYPSGKGSKKLILDII